MNHMTPRPKGSAYEAWLAPLQAKYPDAVCRHTGEYGWRRLDIDNSRPALVAQDGGAFYTDVSSKSYSPQWLIGKFDHVTNTGKYFVPVENG